MEEIDRAAVAAEERQQIVQQLERGGMNQIERDEIRLAHGEAREGVLEAAINACDLRFGAGFFLNQAGASQLTEVFAG